MPASGLLTLEQAEEAVGDPARSWPGRCMEIAVKLVRAGAVPGRAVYGHFRGPVAPSSMFYAGSTLGFVQHGWVLLPDGATVLDPTRWVFEDTDPYLYEGPLHPAEGPLEYDEGGNVLRWQRLGQPPAWDPSERQIYLALAQDAATHVAELLLSADAELRVLGISQAMWLANAPLELLGAHAEAIFRAFVRAGMTGLLPIDNRQRVLGA